MMQVVNLAEGETIQIGGIVFKLESTSGGRAKIGYGLAENVEAQKIRTPGQPRLARRPRLIERLREAED